MGPYIIIFIEVMLYFKHRVIKVNYFIGKSQLGTNDHKINLGDTSKDLLFRKNINFTTPLKYQYLLRPSSAICMALARETWTN